MNVKSLLPWPCSAGIHVQTTSAEADTAGEKQGMVQDDGPEEEEEDPQQEQEEAEVCSYLKCFPLSAQ